MNEIPIHDLHPRPSDMRAEILEGLRSDPKTLPCKYFYDDEGSKLFDRICDLDEYYVTRTELSILERCASEIAERIGPDVMLIELGSGSSTKTHILLSELEEPAAYVPVDISRSHLQSAALRIDRAFPEIDVRPVCADFCETFSAPETASRPKERFVFFPGSTIGNFDVDGQRTLLERIREMCAPEGGGLIIGIDLVKDREVLEAAYDDASGVTADFNMNLLRRINRELGANFEMDAFRHEAYFDEVHERVEMHLVSEREQTVEVGSERIHLEANETICTEHSHKFRVERFVSLAEDQGFALDEAWTDDDDYFAVLLLRLGDAPTTARPSPRLTAR